MSSTLPGHCFNDTVLDALLQFDGDIAGLGVRLSFYLQTFILVLLVDRSPEDAPGSLWTLTATSCGLTVAAIVQVASQSLSLLEAILVSQLVWLANIACFIASASYSRTQGKDNLVKFAHVGQGYLSMILTIIMWRYADKLGQFSECNALVKFVVMFGLECEAITVGRTIALVFASVTLGAYTYLTLKELQAWSKQRRRRKKKAQKRHHGSNRHSRRRQLHGKVYQRSKWLPFDVDAKLVGVVLSQLIIFAYFLSTTELIIRKTGRWQEANHTWGFGQVFALMVITPSVIALVRGMKVNRMARRRDKEQAAEEGRMANSPRAELANSPHHEHQPDQTLHPPDPRSPGASSDSSIYTDGSSMHA